jgi:LAGLIDADG-like domain
MLMPRPSTYEIDSAYFATIDTPNKAYWLGVLAADGCVYYTQNKWRFQFIIAEKDQSWLLMFRNEVSSNHPVRILPGGFGTPCCRFVVTNQHFCSTLLTLNFKSADILQRVAEALHPHFIRGLFDGDGSIRKERGTPRPTGYIPQTLEWALVSQSRELLESLQRVFVLSCNVALNKLSFHNNVWRWKVRGNKQVMRIAAFLYPEGEYCYLARKRALFV